MHAGHDHGGGGGPDAAAAANPAGSIFVDAGNTTATPFVDAAGATTWAPDAGFVGGKRARGRFAVAGTADAPLFATRRQGRAFAYALPAADGAYTLQLLFVDTVKKAGRRLFHVDAEGQRIETAVDIAARVGRRAALAVTHEVTVTGGVLDLAFTGQKGKAVVSAIALVPSAGVGQPTPLAPAAPANLAAAAQSPTSIALTWSDLSTDETAFELERSADGGVTFAPLATLPAGATAHLDQAGLAPARAYHYRVRAVNAAGPSAWSNVAAATTPAVGATPTAPAAPTDLSAQVVSGTAVDLAWSDNSGNETGFVIERSTGGGAYAALASTGPGATTYRDETASAGTSYAYRVRAANAAGQSAASNEAFAATPAAGAAPAAPSGLSAAAVSGNAIRLNWADNSDDETAFVVERATPGGAFSTLATLGAGATSYDDSPVSAGDTFVYRVRATNAFGASGPSNESSATTPTEPQPTDPFTRIDWATRAAAPIKRAEALRAAVGGKLYVFAGFSGTEGPVARADVYDPATNTWSRIADMPRRLTHAGTVADGRDVYFVGGYIGTGPGYQQQFGTAEVWKYNVDSDTYTRMADLPAARAGGGAAVIGRTLHYFSGNNSARQDVGDHYALNLDNPGAGWSARAALPGARSHMGYTAFAGRIYAIGGQTGNDEGLTTKNAVHAYDPATDTWTARAAMPKAISHISSATFVLGGRIVVAGGETAHNRPAADVFAYDPATDTWAALNNLPAARFSGVAAAIGDLAYFTGGSGQTTTYRGTPA
jgi:N-acetylneuraminic acid mutarotase